MSRWTGPLFLHPRSPFFLVLLLTESISQAINSEQIYKSQRAQLGGRDPQTFAPGVTGAIPNPVELFNWEDKEGGGRGVSLYLGGRQTGPPQTGTKTYIYTYTQSFFCSVLVSTDPLSVCLILGRYVGSV